MRILLTIFSLLLTLNFYGQSQDTVLFDLEEEVDTSLLYFDDNWAMPTFPGGPEKMKEIIRTNSKYPIKALIDKVSGTVIVEFTVDTFGNTTNINVVKGIREDLNNEAIRLVDLLDGWSFDTSYYAKHNTKFTIPIHFNNEVVKTNKGSNIDTIYTENADSLIIRYYNKNGTIFFDDIFIDNKLICRKTFIYYKNYYEIETITKNIKPKKKKIEYFDYNNTLIKKEQKINGKYEGKSIEYYDNNQIKCISNFNNGKLNGNFIVYHANGKEFINAIYSNDRLVKINCLCDDKGNKLKIGTFKNGNGIVYNYDGKCNLKEYHYYKNGKLKKIKKVDTCNKIILPQPHNSQKNLQGHKFVLPLYHNVN